MPGAKLSILWSPNAQNDLIDIWAYLAREAGDRVADNQLHEIERACATLESFPYQGRLRDNLLPGVRSMPSQPYVIFYRLRNEAIEIIRVLHGRRDIDAIFTEPSRTP